jgi:hypothetical protein
LLNHSYTGTVTPSEALALVQGAASVNQLEFYGHAFASHNATRRDIRLAIKGATRTTYQPEKDRWRIEGGNDDDGQPLTVVVEFDADRVTVITAF